MDDRDITIEHDAQVSRKEAAERAIDLKPCRGDFEINHVFLRYVSRAHLSSGGR